MKAVDWFRKRSLEDGLIAYDEPFMNVYVRANIYLVHGRDLDLLVDTGMGVSRLSEAIDTVSGKPLLALATHIHLDHVGSLHEFDERAGPAYSADAFATMPDEATYAHMFRDLPDPISELPSPGWSAAGYRLAAAPLTQTLREGDVVDLGDRCFTVLHLPGHSPDSIGLLDERDGIFFSGDAIYDGGLIDDLPDCDRRAYRRTMARILDLPVRVAFGGHGAPFDGARMRAIAARYLSGAEDRRD
jgi:glyoxylase-like metal-dependent hydrolase (beta-lactamase superfamily II)